MKEKKGEGKRKTGSGESVSRSATLCMLKSYQNSERVRTPKINEYIIYVNDISWNIKRDRTLRKDRITRFYIFVILRE